MSKTTVAVIAYAALTIFTFGHAVNNPFMINTGDKVWAGYFSLIAPPLYWSWYLQRR